MNKWFRSLPFVWQNVIGFGSGTIAGVGMAWVIVKVIPAEYTDIVAFILLFGAAGCLLRVAIGMHLDNKKAKEGLNK